jgi:peptide/histidine transporter 3/4
VAILGLGLAAGGAMSNMVVYLVTEYNVPSVDAAQISTIISGSISLAPVLGAVVADAFFGSYPIVAVAMVMSVLVIRTTDYNSCVRAVLVHTYTSRS